MVEMSSSMVRDIVSGDPNSGWKMKLLMAKAILAGPILEIGTPQPISILSRARNFMNG